MKKQIVRLRKAEIVQAKVDPSRQSVGVVAVDPFLGRLWFKTSQTAALGMRVGYLLSGLITVTDKKKDILFCESLKDACIESRPISSSDE